MSFLKHGIQTGIAAIVIQVFSLLIGVINARVLGAQAIGILVLLLLLKNLSFTFVQLGFGTSLKYFVAKKLLPKEKAVVYTIIFGLVSSIFIITVVALFWKTNISIWKDIDPIYIKIYLALTFIYFYINFFKSILNGTLEITAINISDSLLTIVHFIGIVFLVLIFKVGILGALIANFISHVIVLIYLSYHVNILSLFKNRGNKIFINGFFTKFKPLMSFGKWSYFVMLTNILYKRTPMIILKYFTSNEIIGYYSKSIGLQEKSQILITPFQNLLFSYTASSTKETALERTNKLLRIYFTLLIIISIVSLFLIKWIILFMYGKEFLPSVNIFYTLLPAMVFSPLFAIIGAHISGSGKIKEKFIIGVSILPIIVLSGIFLIIKYKALGAGITVSITYFLLFIVSMFYYLKIENCRMSDILFIKLTDLKLIKQKIENRLRRLKK